MITFKLLDMLIEWIVVRNNQRVGHTFAEKQKQLAVGLAYPACLEERAWLKERLLGLCIALEPSRSAIVHSKTFSSAVGGLQTAPAPSKNGKLRRALSLTPAEIRTLARTVAQSVRLVTGEVSLDQLGEKRTRHALDQLILVHGKPSLHQDMPEPTVVRQTLQSGGKLAIDFDRIRADAARIRPATELVFLEVQITDALESNNRVAWIIPWAKLPTAESSVSLSREELFQFAVKQDRGEA